MVSDCGGLLNLEGKYRYDPIRCILQFGCESEGELFHIIRYPPRKINYEKKEYADIQLNLGETRGNSVETARLYAERFNSYRISGYFEH
jgi:hypothetical protein